MEVSKSKASGLTALLNDKAVKPNQKQRRTHYTVTPDKYNLIEVQRKVHRVKVNNNRTPKHINELYNLDKKRSATREKLVNEKTQELKNETYSFRPELNMRSELLMMNNEVELVERTKQWLRQKDDKRKEKKEEKERIEHEKDMLSRVAVPEFPKSNIDVNSKVRMMLEMSASKNKSTSQTHNKSLDPAATNKNNYSSLMNTSDLKRY